MGPFFLEMFPRVNSIFTSLSYSGLKKLGKYGKIFDLFWLRHASTYIKLTNNVIFKINELYFSINYRLILFEMKSLWSFLYKKVSKNIFLFHLESKNKVLQIKILIFLIYFRNIKIDICSRSVKNSNFFHFSDEDDGLYCLIKL